MTARLVMSDELGVSFFIDERFADTGLVRDEELPTAHFIASVPGDGWIAALSIVTVGAEP